MPTYRRNIHIGGEKRNFLQERQDYSKLLDRLEKLGGNIIPLSLISTNSIDTLIGNNAGTIGTYIYLESTVKGGLHKEELYYKTGETHLSNGYLNGVYERRELSDKDLYLDLTENGLYRYVPSPVGNCLKPLLLPDKSLGMEKLNFTPICEVDTSEINNIGNFYISGKIEPRNTGVLYYSNLSDVKLAITHGYFGEEVAATINELSIEDIDDIIRSVNPIPKITAKAAAKPSNNKNKIEIINL